MDKEISVILSAYDSTSAAYDSAISNAENYRAAIQTNNAAVAQSASNIGQSSQSGFGAIATGAMLASAKIALVGGAIAAAGITIYQYWDEIKSGFSSLVSYITDTAASFGNWISETFGGVITGALGVMGSAFTSVYNVVAGVFVGLSNGSITWRTIFEGAVTGVLYGIASVEFVMKNWRREAELVFYAYALAGVKSFNIVEHFLTEVVPKTAIWFWENWRDIFKTLWDYTSTVFLNMSANIMDFLDAVVAWFNGDGFDFKWRGLTEGFESSLKELPQILEREKGALEKELELKVGGLAFDLGKDFKAHLDQRVNKDWKDVPRHAADALAGAAGDVGKTFAKVFGFAKDVGSEVVDRVTGKDQAGQGNRSQLADLQNERFVSGVAASGRNSMQAQTMAEVKKTNGILGTVAGFLSSQLSGNTKTAVKAAIEAAKVNGVQLGN